MPPRYAYWTILIDNKPTAFRAREKEEMLPTFHQLRRTNRDVVLKWFARGRLWETPEAAQAAGRADGRRAREAGQGLAPRRRTPGPAGPVQEGEKGRSEDHDRAIDPDAQASAGGSRRRHRVARPRINPVLRTG